MVEWSSTGVLVGFGPQTCKSTSCMENLKLAVLSLHAKLSKNWLRIISNEVPSIIPQRSSFSGLVAAGLKVNSCNFYWISGKMGFPIQHGLSAVYSILLVE